jgi:extradiol dioxygenase family protein
MPLQPFHVAVPVHDLQLCRSFYTDVLGCSEGRTSDQWVDLDFFGHQFVLHHSGKKSNENLSHNKVDGHEVPVPHYGVVLGWEQWERLADALRKKNVEFVIEPYIRFKGLVGEQATMFFYDPSGNALEFKAFKNIDQLFAK